MRTYLRFLKEHKFYTLIEIIGISVALAFIIPLLSYTNDLWRLDHENRDYDRIYTMTLWGKYLGGCFDQPEFLKSNIPEVEQTTLFSATRPADIKIGDESYSIELLLCDLDFFDFFPTRFISGNRNVLSDNTNALVSESFARKAGWGRDAVGKHFVLDDLEYTVEGIIGDYERSLMLPHDVVINIAGPTLQYYWKNPQRMHQKDLCLFKVKDGTDRDELIAKIRSAARNNYSRALYLEEASEEDVKRILEEQVNLFRYDELSDISGGCLTASKSYLFDFVLILSLVLLMFALFNYIALNVAMGSFRAKEMATRRLLGSSRKDVLGKLLKESLILTSICFVLGVAVSYLIVPQINAVFRTTGLGFDVRVGYNWQSLLMYVALGVVVGLIAGFVPAILISRYKAIEVIKGEMRAKSKMVFSKVFIFVQCLVTMVLLTASLVYVFQYRKMVSLPLGADVKDVYYLYGPYAHHELDPAIEALRKLPFVEKIGYCDDKPGTLSESAFITDESGSTQMIVNTSDGAEEKRGYNVSKLYCDRGAFEAYGFKIVKDFKREEDRVGYLTEGLVKLMGLNPEDIQPTQDQLDNLGITAVGGIIEDFRGSYYYDNATYVCIMDDWYVNPTAYYKSLAIKVNGHHGAAEKEIMECLKNTLDQSWGIYKEPHSKGFVPALNREHLKDEHALMILILMFAGLMLILSLLGLTGLSTWFISLKEHDIAVRKVFGGTVSSETWKNVRGYMILVVIACLVAIPLAWYICKDLLSVYVHRVNLSAWFFIAALLIIVAFSFAAVSIQTLRVTRLNPAGVLKKE